MRATRQLHPRNLARAAESSLLELFAAFVLGLGVALFLVVAIFVLAIGFVWHFYKAHWDKIVKGIEEAAKQAEARKKADAEKVRVEKEAEAAKAQPSVDAANEIIRE